MSQDSSVDSAFHRHEEMRPTRAYATPESLVPQAPSYSTEDGLLDISVPKRDQRTRIPFRLSGDPHIYTFRPPKLAVMLMPIIQGSGGSEKVISASMEWLGSGLSEEDNVRILDRLRDPEDDFDMDSINAVIQELAGRVGKRPPS